MAKIENVIYILTNPQYPGYIKIGYASDLKQRLSSLNTGALVEFIPYAVYETPKDKGDLEVHKIIELLNPILRASKFDNGKSKLKEFFKLEPEEAYELLHHIAVVSGTEKHLYKVDINFNKLTANDDKDEEMVLDNAILPNGTYHMERKIKRENVTAKATIKVLNNTIVLLAGSYICPSEAGGISDAVREIRNHLDIKNNILQKDVSCTLNESAMIVLGGSCNAWTNWKNNKDEYIDIYRKEDKNGSN